MSDGLVIASVGVAAGRLVGFILARTVGKFTAEMQVPGMLPLIASAAVILAAAMIACTIPAARAAGVDPAEALRSE
ncbi:MAG: hypothetical protein ACHP79_04300 [Terriglobales bacterium]